MSDTDVMLGQIWQVVAPYLIGAWELLKKIWAEAPMPLLIGVILGLLLGRLVKAALIVMGVAAVVYLAVRVFGVPVPGAS